jgi:hypothetical protein
MQLYMKFDCSDFIDIYCHGFNMIFEHEILILYYCSVLTCVQSNLVLHLISIYAISYYCYICIINLATCFDYMIIIRLYKDKVVPVL